MDPSFQDQYYTLVKEYISLPNEAPLAATAELGRKLVQADVPVEEIGELQERALNRLAQDLPDKTLDAAAPLFSIPLVELLMAYGLAFREHQAELKQVEQQLQQKRQKEFDRQLDEERVSRTKAETAANARKEADLRRRQLTEGGEIIAESPVMKKILEQAAGIARTDSPVLIEGETGTGKEVIAEFIHRESLRKDGIMSVVNCGALSETLVDAELFGYEKGAFTGAVEARQGIIEVADKGTLLLDEIGDVPPSTQIRLLRFLERGVIRRIGAIGEKPVDTRVLAATHRTLEDEVAAGRFREDLYHRLLVFRISLPPLRERKEDILLLAEHKRAWLARRRSTPEKFDETAMKALLVYAWPGNVRELLHTVERACFAAHLAQSDTITAEHLNLPASSSQLGVHLSLAETEKRHIMSVLKQCDNNRKKAAEILGTSERNLYRLLKKHSPDSVNE